MMSLSCIRDMANEAGQAAEQAAKEPAIFTAGEIARGNVGMLRKIPNLGTYLPQGWSRVELESGHGVYSGDNAGFGAYMVDSCGFGRAGEPALTIGEFIDQLKPGLGYGIVECGQFQIKIGAFARNTMR